MVGSLFVVGIVVGCSTLTRMGDIVGRVPTYKVGLVLHIVSVVCLVLSTSLLLTYILIFAFGLSVTARYYVGYTYNLEM